MACINFINISVNSATARLREIGIRKVMGSSKGQLRVQFMLESILTVGLSGLIAIALYPLLSKSATGIFGKELPMITQLSGTFWLGILLGLLFIGVLAGLYPAFRLSSYRTILSVKGKLPISLERTLIMKGLVGVQLTIATIVLIATTVIVAQINLFFSRDMGYDKDHLLTVQVPRDWSPEGLERIKQILERMLSNSVVESITLSYDIPAAMNSGSAQLKSNTSDAVGMLFIRDLSTVFILSAAVALPIAYLLMQGWLQSYHLKTSLDIYKTGLPILLLAGLSILLIVAQTIRTALANPVNSLRDE